MTIVKKVRGGVQDLLLGKGTVQQERAGGVYNVDRLDISVPVDSIEELQALDVANYTRARVYTSVTEFVDYIYDAADGTGIAASVPEGSWFLAGNIGVEAELTTGTETTSRWWSPKTLARWIVQFFVRNKDTIADLRNTEPLIDKQSVNVVGHTVAGLGGDMFWHDADDTTTPDNNGTVIRTTVGDKCWKRKEKGFVTPEDFGCLADGSDETVNLQSWLDSSTSLVVGTKDSESFIEYLYTNLVMSKENHQLSIIGDVRFRTTNTSTTSSFILSGNFATINKGFFVGTDDTGATIETTGFSNYLNQVQASGTSRNALKINGLETKVNLGRYRGGSDAAVLVEKPDAFLLGPYLEQGKDGLKAVGIGSINGYHIHSFGNTEHGFNLSGSSFSQLTSCYADTNGKNGYEFRDMSAGLTMTDCWSFKSGKLVANSAQMQFFNCQNTKLIGCRMSTPGAAGTSESIRFSGTTNQIDLISCYADQATKTFTAPNTMTSCTGALQEYSRAYSTYLDGAETIAASGTHDTTVKINCDTSIISPGFKAFDIRVTYRSSSGAAMIGVEDSTVFITNGITGVGSVAARFPEIPILQLSNPVLSDTGGGQATLAVTATNTDATKAFQYTVEVVERSTTRGYI